MEHPYHPPRIRRELCSWIASDSYTHALRLNTDRVLSIGRLKDIFGTFCYRYDKSALGIRNLLKVPSSQRLRAIAFPENLETNAHLHVAADLSAGLRHLGSEWRSESVV